MQPEPVIGSEKCGCHSCLHQVLYSGEFTSAAENVIYGKRQQVDGLCQELRDTASEEPWLDPARNVLQQ